MPIETEKRKSARLTFKEALLENRQKMGFVCMTPSDFCGTLKKKSRLFACSIS